MKVAAIAAVLAASVSLASCVTSGDSQQAAARTLDTICAAEPAVYAAFSAVVEAKEVSPSKVRKIEAAHTAITNWCTDRPENIVAIIVTITSTYAQILLANEQYGE